MNDFIPQYEDTKPAENVFFSPTKRNYAALQKAFTSENPLDFIDDEKVRKDLDFVISQAENPDEERRKWALAAYFSQMQMKDLNFCHGNLDGLIARYNNGQPQSVDSAYKSVQELFKVQQQGEGNTGNAAKAGFAQLGKRAADIGWTLTKLLMFNPAEIEAQKMFLDEKSKAAFDKGIEGLKKGVDERHKDTRGYYQDVYDKNAYLALDADWFTRWNNGRWFRNAFNAFVMSAPDMALQLTAAKFMGPAVFAATIGTTSAVEKYYDNSENSNMTEEQRAKNAIMTGAINSGAAWLLGSMVKGKVPFLNKIQFKNEMAKYITYFASAYGSEFTQEAAEQLAENAVDLHTGVYGDVAKISPADYRKKLWNGVFESGFIGGFPGAGGAALGFKAFKQNMQYRNQVVSNLENAKQEILNSENLTDTQKAAVAKIDILLDAGNINDMAAAGQALAEVRQVRESEQQQQEITEDMPYEQQIEINSAESEENIQLRNMLKFNPQDTVDEANALAENFNDIDLHIFNTPEELPSEILSQIEHDGIDQNRVRAWIDMDNMRDVYLVASNVRPSDVSRTLGHEIIGHKGLRSVFGENFNTILDSVYNSHSEELIQYARTYNRDTETIESRRYLTEEFLSDCADLKVKPSWWKEFIASIRQMLRRIFPKMRISDADINGWLSKAHRAAQQQSPQTGNNNGVRYALFDSIDKRTPVLNALQKIAAGSEEETVSNLRNDLEQFGGTNDITFYWGNEKKGIYHIAYRRGIDTLFHVIDTVADGKINRFVEGNKTVILEKDGFEAVLALTEYNKQKSWLLTGWKTNEPDEISEVSTQSDPTQLKPTFSRQELGAGLVSILSQLPEKSSGNQEKMRFSISPVWTGSAADYDKPSLHAVGTGEGQQVYGWGLYGSESREVAEWYANNVAKEKSGSNKFEINGEIFTPYSKPKDSIREIIWLAVIQNDIESKDELLENLKQQKRIRQNDLEHAQVQDIDFFREQLKEIENTIQFAIDSDIIFRHDYIGKRNLYRQTFWGDKEENLLDWDGMLTKEQVEKIIAQMDKDPRFEKEDYEKAKAERGHYSNVQPDTYRVWEEDEEIDMKVGHSFSREWLEQFADPEKEWASIEHLYDAFARALGSPKAASEFLYAAGIDGITYIGDSSGVRNYVAFSDEDIRIDEHIRFSVAPVIESNKQWRDPDSDPRMIELEQQKAEALKDTLNALSDNGQRFDEWDDEWAEMSEDERIEHITGSYDDTMSELYQEIEEEQQFSREDAESLISQAYDATVQYAEQLGYTVKANDISRKSLSTYITVNNGSEDFKIRISDHWNINRSGVEHFGNNDVDVIVQNDKIDLSDVWQFLEENAPDNGNVRFSIAPQVDTPEFKNWFGDSKVVDENGNPLVVYHGTDRYGFTVFRDDSHFTADYDYAKRYANKGRKDTESGVYAVYLSIQNPFDIRNPDDRKIFTEYRQGHIPAETKTGAMDWAEYDYEDFREYLQENYPQKYDGIILDEGGDADNAHRGIAYVPFSPTQIKSATDNVGTFDPNNPDIRFSVIQMSEDEQNDYVNVLKPFMLKNPTAGKSDVIEFLKGKGVNISDKEAWYCAMIAHSENKSAIAKERVKRRNDWLYENVDLYRQVIDVAGSDFKIKPSFAFNGEDFTGSFISKEWRKYSRKRKQRNDESDKQYKNYLKRREKALANAEGMSSDEIAQAIAEKYGQDAQEVEQKLIDFFRDLTKNDLNKKYSDYLAEKNFETKELDRRLLLEWDRQQEQERIQEALEIITKKGTLITPEWINENTKTYKKLYEMVLGEKAPGVPTKKQINALNVAIMNESDNAPELAKGYKIAYDQLTEEFNVKLRSMKDKMLADKFDIQQVQQAAKDFAYANVDRGFREKFISRAIALGKYPNTPTAKYPNGRRQAELEKLMSEMLDFQENLHKQNAILEINQLLKRNKTKRTAKNVPFSPMGERQVALDRIAAVVKMSPETVAGVLRYDFEQKHALSEALEKLVDADEDTENKEGRILAEIRKSTMIFFISKTSVHWN